MSNEVFLKAQNKADVVLAPKDHTVWLQEPSGIPYVELSNITVADQYKNSHVKTLSGIYTGGRPTRIKVRDHYPHSIGTGWCRKSNLMTSETNTTRVNVAKTQEFIPVVGENNYTSYKECAFWGSVNTMITVGDLQVANSMYYDIIEPYAPEEGTASYYGDRMSAVGVPMPTTPSPWYYATIDYTEQTWEAEITLNPFTMFYGTSYQQNYVWWNPYHVSTYPKGLNYDPRLHAIEVDITSTYEGETIHGKRIYYIWHLPHCFAAEKAPQITINDGTYSGPFDHHICGGGIGCQYDTGYTASGGDCTIEFMKHDILHQNMLLQLYPAVSLNDERLYNPCSICIDGDGNYYILNNKYSNRVISKYDSNRNFIKDSGSTSMSSAGKILYYNGFIYAGYYWIGKYDPENLLVVGTIGGYGTGDGKFNQYPKFTIYDDRCYAVISTKLQVFDIDGTYLAKLLPPTGYSFYDITADEDTGNLYVRLYKSGDTTNSYIYVYDSELDFLTSWPTIYPYSGICFKNGYLYVQNNSRIEKQDPVDGTIISGHDITCSGFLMVDDENNIYVYETDAVNVLNNTYTSLYKIGNNTIKYTSRNGNAIGLIELSQLKKAYAVVGPSSFDPTNPATYTAMTEYTGADFNEITLTADGLLKFKNLYPAEATHYIYIIFDCDYMGEIDTYYCDFDFTTGVYSPYDGNRRDYKWFTRSPSCSEICAGSSTQGNNKTITYPTSKTTNETVTVSLDTFDTGTDLSTCTIKYYIGGCSRFLLYGSGNDGGRTKFWIYYGDDGVKKNYNSLNDATNILAWGICNTTYILYGDGVDVGLMEVTGKIGISRTTSYEVNLINRILKNGSYLSTGFVGVYNIERIAT